MPRRSALEAAGTRDAILRRSADIASVEGLEGVTIGRLATDLEMSKAGVIGHFGSKEELQLAAIDTAAEIFTETVIRPAREPETAFARLEALCESFLRYLEASVFPGGCFFASATAELDTHPGPVREKLVAAMDAWLQLIERRVREAQEAGELDAGEEPALLAFELDAFMKMGNSLLLLHGDRSGLDQAHTAIRARLDRARVR
jgi:AcrR family transcriptional regulator